MANETSHGKRTRVTRRRALLGVAMAAGTVSVFVTLDMQGPKAAKVEFAPQPSSRFPQAAAAPELRPARSPRAATRTKPEEAAPVAPPPSALRHVAATPEDDASLSAAFRSSELVESASADLDQEKMPVAPEGRDRRVADDPIALVTIDTEGRIPNEIEPLMLPETGVHMIATQIAPGQGTSSTTHAAAPPAPVAEASTIRIASVNPGIPSVAPVPKASELRSFGPIESTSGPTRLAESIVEPVAYEAEIAAPEQARTDHDAGLDPRADIAQISLAESQAYFAQLTAGAEKSRLAVRYQGREIGTVAFQVAAENTISVHIGQVLDLFEGRFDAGQFAFLRNSAASEQFVPLDRLQAAGIPARYDPVYDEIVLSPSAG